MKHTHTRSSRYLEGIRNATPRPTKRHPYSSKAINSIYDIRKLPRLHFDSTDRAIYGGNGLWDSIECFAGDVCLFATSKAIDVEQIGRGFENYWDGEDIDIDEISSYVYSCANDERYLSETEGDDIEVWTPSMLGYFEDDIYEELDKCIKEQKQAMEKDCEELVQSIYDWCLDVSAGAYEARRQRIRRFRRNVEMRHRLGFRR